MSEVHDKIVAWQALMMYVGAFFHPVSLSHCAWGSISSGTPSVLAPLSMLLTFLGASKLQLNHAKPM